MTLGLLDHGIGLALAVAVVVVAILLLVERQLLLAHGGQRARTTAGRRSRVIRLLTLLAFAVIVARMVQLLNP